MRFRGEEFDVYVLDICSLDFFRIYFLDLWWVGWAGFMENLVSREVGR